MFPVHDSQNNNMVIVRYHHGKWEYTNNYEWFDLSSIQDSDVLLARIDMTTDSISLLEGKVQKELHYGIRLGYASGDLTAQVNRWGSEDNDGEFQIVGTYVDIVISNSFQIVLLADAQLNTSASTFNKPCTTLSYLVVGGGGGAGSGGGGGGGFVEHLNVELADESVVDIVVGSGGTYRSCRSMA